MLVKFSSTTSIFSTGTPVLYRLQVPVSADVCNRNDFQYTTVGVCVYLVYFHRLFFFLFLASVALVPGGR